MAIFLWCAVAVSASLGERSPSDACVQLSAQGYFDEANWTFQDVWPSALTSRMHEDNRSFIILPELGRYDGAEGVREYMLYLSRLNIMFESTPVVSPLSGHGFVHEYDRIVIAPNGEATSHTMCSWISSTLFVPTSNSSMAVDAFNLGTFTVKTMIMVRHEFSLTDMNTHGMWVWYPPDTLLLASTSFSSVAAAQYTCDIIRSVCPEVWALNSAHYNDTDSCIDHQGNTSIVDQHGVWIGRSRACRNLHVVFASQNPHHCAHLSTVPMADPNGAFKCQDEADGGPTYLPAHYFFSDAEIEFGKQFGRQYGLYSGEVGGYEPVYDVASAFDPITTFTNANEAYANEAFRWSINVYILLAMLLF